MRTLMIGLTAFSITMSVAHAQAETELEAILISSDLERPLGMASPPGDRDRLFVVEQTGYVRIIENFERLTGRRDLYEDVSDKLDYGARIARVSYVLGGREVHKELRFEDDWADPFFVAELADDIESTIGDGRRFWAADNGQASVLIFCNEETAKALNALRPRLVLPYT